MNPLAFLLGSAVGRTQRLGHLAPISWSKRRSDATKPLTKLNRDDHPHRHPFRARELDGKLRKLRRERARDDVHPNRRKALDHLIGRYERERHSLRQR